MNRDDFRPSESVSRRQALTAIGAGTLAGLAGGFVLSDPVEMTSPDESIVDSPSGAMEAVDEAETPYAVWQYRPAGRDGMTATLPINVVFPLEHVTAAAVVEVFLEARLVSHPAEYTRYGWDRDREVYRPSSWSGAETFYGGYGRIHVRCWDLAGTLSVQTHIDTPATPTHSIHSHAKAREIVETLFLDAGWHFDDERYWLGNASADHDGAATVVRHI